jgi:threonine/homoserine/homoserine lactone efflux protein
MDGGRSSGTRADAVNPKAILFFLALPTVVDLASMNAWSFGGLGRHLHPDA